MTIETSRLIAAQPPSPVRMTARRSLAGRSEKQNDIKLWKSNFLFGDHSFYAATDQGCGSY